MNNGVPFFRRNPNSETLGQNSEMLLLRLIHRYMWS